MKGKLASRRAAELRRIQDERLNREFRERVNGTRRYNTFDLEDIGDHLNLEVLSDPLLRDVKQVILWADEKRRAMEDYRALRRNRNDWLILLVSVVIGVGLPFILPEILVWVLNACTLVPQSVLLAIKTVRRY